MDIGILRGILTVMLFVLFLGIVAWSWSRKRGEEFARAASLPLEDQPLESRSSEEKAS